MSLRPFSILSLRLGAVIIIASLSSAHAFAVTETVIHSFGPANDDGQVPFAGVMQYKAAFYGTTTSGGQHGAGTVFSVKLVNGIWREKLLYAFTGGSDGNDPQSKVIFDNAGNLYGTTNRGGTDNCGCGTVFELSPHNGSWAETVIHNFTGRSGGNDGAAPIGGLLLDVAGNLYGTTTQGGTNDAGTVFKLAPSGGSCTETVIYNFGGKADGAAPGGDLIFDKSGNLYGTTAAGGTFPGLSGQGGGTAFKLTLNPDGTWSEMVLHSFGAGNDGTEPIAGLAGDLAGNLYGTTIYGGGTPNGGHGAVFQLTPSNGVWTESVISNFTTPGAGNYPQSPLTVDPTGNLYGAANGGAGRHGVIFKLSLGNGVWTHTPFYTFPDVPSGTHPTGSLLLDAAGHFYGTTVTGGPGCGCHGLVYMLAP
jgi:uncharacterized repeat protein (TIGR03803 family)